jgi:hypothetical protein
MSNPPPGYSDLQSAVSATPGGFPFRCELSLRPLVDFWTEGIAAEQAVKGALGRLVEQEIRKVPELLEPITDLSLVARHRDLIDTLMAPVFPAAFWEGEYAAALIPFHLRSFYATPSFERMLMGDGGMVQARVNADGGTVAAVRLRYACALILHRVYGMDADVDTPLVFITTDPDTGLDRYFKVLFDSRFLEVETIGPVPSLPPDARPQALLADPQALLELLRPERFVIRGFTVFRAVEVTDQEVLSALKRDLIDKESIVSAARFQGLQARLRTLLRRPELRLGLSAIDGDRVLMLNYGARLDQACIFASSAHRTVAEFSGSIFDRAARQQRPLVVDDLARVESRTAVEDEILRSGVRSLVVAPLEYQDQLIGMLNLESPVPEDLSPGHIPKVGEVLPLFTMAVKRSMEELETRIQAYIKDKCTAIHHSVEWRFRKAVLNSLERTRSGIAIAAGDMEPIVFPEVYPLYGLSDIRGSSTQRALSIQTDLLAQLDLAADVLRTAHQARPLPALDELLYRTGKHLTGIGAGLRTGDEMAVIGFLRAEIEPLFDHLQGFDPGVRRRVEAYRAALEPRLGTVYQRRKAFEDSVTLINDAISSYLDLEQQAAQAMCPHYFEKQQTDGVDYSIYAGASLLESGRFDPLYLRNLRLWQLMVTCGIAIRAERLKDRLALPLETAHLILVQHVPLSIRFRFDEKRFDVDGAYNIRYEIIKKRIDKATVRATHERLTQPGRIAIVYAQPGEAAEYRDYIEYLQHLGYLEAEIEDFELGELQGVHGLRALRVGIELDNPRLDSPVRLADLERSGTTPAGTR